jgi:hypothetical protein
MDEADRILNMDFETSVSVQNFIELCFVTFSFDCLSSCVTDSLSHVIFGAVYRPIELVVSNLVHLLKSYCFYMFYMSGIDFSCSKLVFESESEYLL